MEEYIQCTYKKSKNNYPHRAEDYYPYGYQEDSSAQNKVSDISGEREIHFLPPHQNDILTVAVMEEEDKAPFELRRDIDGELFTIMAGTMKNGLIDGYCEIYDPNTGKIFDGEWVNGKRYGTCVEYDYGNISFQGSYKNDKRDGYGWEYHDTELQRQGEWHNGIYQDFYNIVNQVDFENVGLGMILFKNEDSLQITTVEWVDSVRRGKALTYSLKDKRVSQERLYLDDEIECTAIPVLDTTISELILPNGLVYKGEVRNGMADGKGKIFNAEGVLLYEGDMFQNMRYGSGKSFLNGVLQYDGMFAMDRMMGEGRSFNEDGSVLNEGVFIDNIFAERTVTVPDNCSFIRCSSIIRSLHIGNNCLNDVMNIDFSLYSLLEDIQIGDESLKELNEFVVKSLPRLKTLHIGRNSLTLCICVVNPTSLSKEDRDLSPRTISNNESRIRSEMKRFEVNDCALLESLIIGKGSCTDFFLFEINELPNLKELVLGESNESLLEQEQSCCFYYAPTFEIMNFPSLEKILIGNRCFFNADVMRIHSLPNVQSIEFGKRACFGRRERSSSGDMKNISRMSIRNLPALAHLHFCNNFVFYSSVCFDNIPSCTDCVKKLKTFPSKELRTFNNVSKELGDLLSVE